MGEWLEHLARAGASPTDVMAAVARSAEVGLALHALACAVVAFLARSAPTLRRGATLTALGLAASAAAYGRGLPGFLVTGVIIYAALFAVAEVARRSADERRVRWRLACGLVVVVAIVFLVGRGLEVAGSGVVLLGVRWTLFTLDMWLALRLVTLVWEVGSGRVERPAPADFALWYSLPFTAIGPVMRYSSFATFRDGMHRREAGEPIVSSEWSRRLALAACQLVGGILLVQLQSTFPSGPGKPRWVNLAVWFGTAPWSFFLIWAGYFRLMEGLARLWRIDLPPSFDAPFGRANISDFWANWNMTATAVFRDYLFYNRWGFRRINAYVNTMILFVLVGLWHGSNAYWVLWGVLHGLGFCAFLFYKRRFAAHSLASAIPRPIAVTLTYVFVCACWALPSIVLKLVGAL